MSNMSNTLHPNHLGSTMRPAVFEASVKFQLNHAKSHSLEPVAGRGTTVRDYNGGGGSKGLKTTAKNGKRFSPDSSAKVYADHITIKNSNRY